MKPKILPSQHTLLKIFYYNHKTGKLYRRLKSELKIVGTNNGGYLYVRLLGLSQYPVHRIVYKMHYGVEPNRIDHIDLDRSNNKINNLRDCLFESNCMNKPMSPRNKSGHKGVSWDKRINKWLVRIRSNNKLHDLGFYQDKSKAILAAKDGYKKLHQEFAHKDSV